MPCLCFRGPNSFKLPNLEGEQVGQQTTALHQSTWMRRWEEGSFVKTLKSGAHLENFSVSVGVVEMTSFLGFFVYFLQSWVNKAA